MSNNKDDRILTFQEFDDIKVSTKTFTAMTNLCIDLKKLFNFLPVIEYNVVPKRRGRKKKNEKNDTNLEIPQGSIITLKYEDGLRGVDLKKKKSEKKRKWFRNSFTVVILIEKYINFKVCRNGTFQMTGCKTLAQAEQCVKHIWNLIKDDKTIYSLSSGDHPEAIFIPAMRNIDFSLGFYIDREKLARYMSTQTECHCLLETSFGYTGVNIKIPLTKKINTINVCKINYLNNEWVKEYVPYKHYLDKLTSKEKIDKLQEERYNTFLVFHSGKTIMSGLTGELMRDTYYTFIDIIRKCHKEIEERLD
jgi:TATA-box binding protein (TBP) (component of TFIID and TFIIIB)|uniref:Uncharacterized protein n=1 Tax=viral metagenome TaxID=1070528 RepID=A0A6C0CZH0_9ZZZZ